MDPLHTTASIVLIGRFKPTDFLPAKLRDGKVISKKSAESASFNVLVPGQQVEFELQWAKVQALPERLQITTTEAPFVRICDFVLKALTDVEVPPIVRAMGINYEAHYHLESHDVRNRIGCRLAPPAAWGEWGQKILATQGERHRGTRMQGGMTSLKMRLPFCMDKIYGWREIAVSPSTRFDDHQGVMFHANHHHQVDRTGSDENGDAVFVGDTPYLLDRLGQVFETSIVDSQMFIEEIVRS